MSSLPPELILDILEHALSTTRHPRRLLKRTSLISPSWRFPSQALLFRHFSRLSSVEDARSWLAAEWSEFAERLEVLIPGPGEGAEVGRRMDDEELVRKAVELEELYASVLSRSQEVRMLELHLSPVVLTSVLSLVSLQSLKHLSLTASDLQHETAFVHGASPPPFTLTSLSLDAHVFPGVLTFLLPSLTSLSSLSIGIDEHKEDNPLEAITAALETAKKSLSCLAVHTTVEPPCFEAFVSSLLRLEKLKTFEYHGTLCDCCSHFILPSLPSTVENLLFSATPFDTVAELFVETVFAEEPPLIIVQGDDGEEALELLPELKVVAVPVKSKKLMGKEARERAEARGVQVKGFKCISGL